MVEVGRQNARIVPLFIFYLCERHSSLLITVFLIVHLYCRFIETFGTHIVVGVKMGGKDVIYLKQQHSSTLQPVDIQKKLKDMADKRFLDANGQFGMPSEQVYKNDKVCDVFVFGSQFSSTV